MSSFSSLTIAFVRNVDADNPDAGDIHTISVDADHDPDTLFDVVERLTGAGYDYVSVWLDTAMFAFEIRQHIPEHTDIVPVFEAFKNDPHDADNIAAFLIAEGCGDIDSWEDRIWVTGITYEEVVTEWAEIFEKRFEETSKRSRYGVSETAYVSTAAIPDYLVIDWKETAEYIAREESNNLVEMCDMIYMFS